MKDYAPFIALIVVGLALMGVAAVVGVRNERHLEAEAKFWRSMYLEAERDAKFKKCLDLDANYVICEKVTNGQER